MQIVLLEKNIQKIGFGISCKAYFREKIKIKMYFKVVICWIFYPECKGLKLE